MAKGGAARVQAPFSAQGISFLVYKLAFLVRPEFLLAVDKSSLNARDSSQCQSVEHVNFESFESYVLLSFVFVIILLVLHNTETDNLLVGIIITEDDCKITSILLLDSRSHILHCKTLV